MATIDNDKLNALVGKMLGDLGGAFSVPTTRIGFRLGLFDALHDKGPATATELANRTGLTERYVREWALAQAANGYVTYERGAERFSLSPEQAMVFAVKDSPVYLAGAFDLGAAMVEGQPKVEAAFRNGGGVAWGDSSGCLFCAVGAFFRPGYVNAVAQAWLPALEGMLPRLQAGAKVADVGCGVGFSTLLMAKAFPNSRFVGYDFHAPSIAQAKAHALAHGLADRVGFETAAAKDIAQRDFDLITMFDCLHDMGDPRRMRQPDAQAPEAGRRLDDRRTHRGRPAGRQCRQPGQPALLQRLDDDLCPHLPRPGSRRSIGCSGRRGETH